MRRLAGSAPFRKIFSPGKVAVEVEFVFNKYMNIS